MVAPLRSSSSRSSWTRVRTVRSLIPQWPANAWRAHIHFLTGLPANRPTCVQHSVSLTVLSQKFPDPARKCHGLHLVLPHPIPEGVAAQEGRLHGPDEGVGGMVQTGTGPDNQGGTPARSTLCPSVWLHPRRYTCTIIESLFIQVVEGCALDAVLFRPLGIYRVTVEQAIAGRYIFQPLKEVGGHDGVPLKIGGVLAGDRAERSSCA